MRSRILLPGALSATAALLTACSTGNGPLGSGGTPGAQCAPGPLGHPLTMGIYDLRNTGTSPVTVTSVTLPAPHGMTITKSWLIPIYRTPREYEVVGVQVSYPPTKWPEWPKRQPIPGAIIRPGQDLNLVFGLTRTTTRWGRSAGPVVAYTANGNAYTVQEQTSLVVAVSSCF